MRKNLYLSNTFFIAVFSKLEDGVDMSTEDSQANTDLALGDTERVYNVLYKLQRFLEVGFVRSVDAF